MGHKSKVREMHKLGGAPSKRTEVPLRQSTRTAAVVLTLAAIALAPVAADAAGEVNVLILKEHGGGSSSSAQQYVDKLIAGVAEQNGWAAAQGKYQTSRKLAKTWISENDPHYGILSLAAFLDLRDHAKLEVLGSAEVSKGGGRQYFLVSSTETSVDGCKGKTLGTDHGDDPRFIDKVVGGQSFVLSDFEVVDTRRPVKTIKAAARGEVACALIDDAQKASLAKVGGENLNVVWSSSSLPGMVIVAFPSAPAAEKKAFKASLGKVCTGAGASACKEVGLASMGAASESDYSTVIHDYDS